MTPRMQLIIGATLLLLGATAEAADQGGMPPGGMNQPGGQMGMAMMDMPMMKQHMSQMREHMGKVRAAKSDKERLQLMQEHMQLMDDHMGMMMNMMEMGGGHAADPAGSRKAPPRPAGVSEEEHKAHHPEGGAK